MIKKMITQLWNERRSNLPLFVELLLISVVMWFVVDTLYVRLSIYFQPKGFDISHVYMVEMDRLSETNKEYRPDRMRNGKESEDILTILHRIQQRPDVEAACVSYVSHPYSGTGNYMWIKYDTCAVKLWHITASPEYFRVFCFKGLHGETPEELAELYKTGTAVFISSNAFISYGIRGEALRGQTFSYMYDEQARPHTFHTILQPARRDDYVGKDDMGFLFAEYSPWFDVLSQFHIRVKPDQDRDFISRFWKDVPRYQEGNVFIRNIASFRDVRSECHKLDDAKNNLYYSVMGFLLLNVFVALFGVFWFRTRQRRQEVAIQMAMGSSRRQVFIRILSEGLCLLIAATIPALLADFYIMKAELVDQYQNVYFTFSRYFLTIGMTFLIIALTIFASIWYPARRATRIHPAEALHE